MNKMETKEEALSELNISQTQILLLVETNQEISLKNAHDFLKNRQNPTSLVPIKPQGRIAFLYYSPGKEGDLYITLYTFYILLLNSLLKKVTMLSNHSTLN